MDIIFLLTIILIVLIIFLAISIIKKVFKVALILGAIFLILFFITGGSIINDYNNLKEKISFSPNVILLQYENNIIAGFLDDQQITLYSNADIDSIRTLYNQGNLKDIQNEAYKVFIFDISLLSDIEINNKQVSKSDLINLYENNVNLDSITYEDLILDLDITNNVENLKPVIFAYIYSNDLKITKSPISFFSNYKEEKVLVYPDSVFFKFTKIIPLSFVEQKLNKLKTTVKDKLENGILE